MSSIVVIIIAIIVSLAIRYMSKRMTVKRKIVFAGHPSSSDMPNVDISPLPQNDPKYKIGDEVINVSELEQMVVRGKSLEYFGIKDGAIVFVKKIGDGFCEFSKLIGRFIVFKIDNQRTLQEYPLKNITIAEDGLKLRKVVKILSKGTTDIETEIKQFLLENDKDFSSKPMDEQTEELSRYLKKFKFASEYYSEDNYLIMSITYRNGVCKDYSFHSPKWLYGIVEYNTK